MVRRLTCSFDAALLDLLEQRARHNRRSISAEIVWLLECALATELEVNVSMMRTLMMAQGGVASIEPPRQE